MTSTEELMKAAPVFLKVFVALAGGWVVRTLVATPNVLSSDRAVVAADSRVERMINFLVIVLQAAAWVIPIIELSLSYQTACWDYSPLASLGVVTGVSGGLLRRVCYAILGRRFTFKLATHDKLPLVTTGPYAVVRHPSYFAATLCWTGASMIFLDPRSAISNSINTQWLYATLWSIPVLLNCFIPPRVRREEEMLLQEFGEQWKEYTHATRWKILPGVW